MNKELNNRQLNEKESLDLITQMIRNTQQRLERGNGIPFLIWGYTSIIVSLLVWYLLTTTGNYRWNYLWFLIPIIGGTALLIRSRNSERGIKTYIDKVIGYIWLTLGITAFLVSSIAMFYWHLPILFIIVILMAIGTALTGLVIRSKPIIIAGFAGIMLSLLCLVIQGANVKLVFAAIFLVMMVIPGHILNVKGRK